MFLRTIYMYYQYYPLFIRKYIIILLRKIDKNTPNFPEGQVTKQDDPSR